MLLFFYLISLISFKTTSKGHIIGILIEFHLKFDGDKMKNYVAFLFQLIVWSCFTFAEWLSNRDHLLYKVIMFLVFLYLAFLLTRMIVKSNRMTIFITIASLSAYFLLQFFLQQMLPSRMAFL